MSLLAIDVGTTHCKAGLFALDGTTLHMASRLTATRRAPEGWLYYDPDALWQTICAAILEATAGNQEPIAAVGIASMAETGLLVDRRTGCARSFFVPWFETTAQSQAARINACSDPVALYRKFGRPCSFKCSLAKLLWLGEQGLEAAEDAYWLSAADFVAHRLTQAFVTDYSLAGYTFAFLVEQKEWDRQWLREWGLPADIFPPAQPSGAPAGVVSPGNILPAGIPVCVCGHDHLCGALAAGVITPGKIFDSMGTAETLIGAMPERPLTEVDYRLGLIYGCHVARQTGSWLGSLSASGGSIEWLRTLLGETTLSYEDVELLLDSACRGPTGILYYPYLLGSGSPHMDPNSLGALIGLSAFHQRADLVKAVLEGTAYEVEYIRRVGEQMAGQAIPLLTTAGGGTRNRAWLQIKADVSGCQIEASCEPEATLLGAALVAGIGCGLYTSETEALAALAPCPTELFTPDPGRHAAYQKLYLRGYLQLQEPLRAYYNSI